jgi:hypothetical protein
MDSTSKTERPSDRRAAERRVKQVVIPGGDKRTAARRTGRDRRTAQRD